jgi:predicted RND superfamily exporter protein
VLVLGILSIVFALVFFPVGLALGIKGTRRGIKLLNNARDNQSPRPGKALAGIICSIMGIVLSSLVAIIALLCLFIVAMFLVNLWTEPSNYPAI